jgi:8-oxo-dGTP pyrophosphatase MutT (NUDIX family)
MSEIRLAATVVVARPGPRGVEVLVLQRSTAHRFLPGYVVFPGGGVEEQDPGLAAAWFGDSSEAARACGLRELAEEVGLAKVAEGWRRVASGGEVQIVGSSPPSAGEVCEISHWIAPEEVPVRFDARFFALAAPRGIEPSADGTETDRAWWARPFDLLVAHAGGGCSLYWPTMKVMEALATCDSVDEVLALRVPQVEPAEGVFVP